jgi:transposase InsO family protein
MNRGSWRYQRKDREDAKLRRRLLEFEVDASLPGLRVVQVLERVGQERGLPETIQVDNGPEFISRVVDQWAYANGVALHFIDPGKPVQNAFIESTPASKLQASVASTI